MDRILKGTAHTLIATFTIDGEATDPAPATATVEVVHADGTELIPAGTATTRLGVGQFAIALEPAKTEVRGDLTASWIATLDGYLQTLETLAEVVDFAAAAARERLAGMVDAATEPTLSTDELWDLIRAARTADFAGVAPDDAEWEGTWDLNAAAAEGWRRKAGKVAPNYSFQVDNQLSDQGQVYRHCLSQAEHYAALISTFVRLK